jgi:hypothetical protein
MFQEVYEAIKVGNEKLKLQLEQHVVEQVNRINLNAG